MFMCFDSFNFPGYEVSNLGRVRRVEDGVILEGNRNTRKSDGATSYSVNIKDRYGRVCTKSVARLVAQLFLQFDPKSKRRIQHKDGNCCNNNVNNLFFKGCSNYRLNTILRKRNDYESLETIHPGSAYIDNSNEKATIASNYFPATNEEEPALLKLVENEKAAPTEEPTNKKKSSLMFSINHNGKKFELMIEFENINEGIEAALATLATAENFYKKE